MKRFYHSWFIFNSFLFTLLLATSCAPSDEIDLTSSGETAFVKQVIDGDTLKVEMDGSTENVRLLLIDTPEMNVSNGEPQPYAIEATEFVKALAEGKEVKIIIGTEERDGFDRILAYVFIDGETIQEKLLREGLARTAYLLNDLRMLDPFHQAQQEAMEQEIGIWSIPGYAVPDTNKGFHWE